MKDFYGTEVKLRDEVICTLKDYRSLVKAEVVKITDKTVLVEYEHPALTYSKQTYRLTSDQFIIVGGY